MTRNLKRGLKLGDSSTKLDDTKIFNFLWAKAESVGIKNERRRVLSRISRPNQGLLVKKSNEIFMNMNPAIFKRSWINTGLIEEKELLEEIDEFEDLDVAEMVLEKEDEENLVENFLALQIDKHVLQLRWRLKKCLKFK